MCGISGIVSSKNITRTLLTSIRNQEYRGYDSCGLALLNDNVIEVRKNTGGVDEVNSKEHLTQLQGNIGIAHTRWATHGGVTKANAHPHLSEDRCFAIAHNGIFSNYLELKAQLLKEGITFNSQTDSEVFVHLVAKLYLENKDIETSFVTAIKRLEGSYAIVLISTHDPERLYCVKKDSPLIIGIGEGQNFVGSDINAFLEYTRRAVILEDNEYAIISKNDYVIKNADTSKPVKKNHLNIDWDAETTKKGGYSHYMLKEIFDEPHTVKQALKISNKDIRKLATMMSGANKVYLMGVGTTYYVSMAGQYYFSKFSKKFFPTLSSDEFQEAAVVTPGDMVLTITQSGETYDTKMSLVYAKDRGASTAAIVNVMGSSVSMLVDHAIMQGSGAEICVVSTKAAFAQIIILIRTAIELALLEETISRTEYDQYYSLLQGFPELIQTTLNEQSGFIRNLARETSHVPNWLFLGCGIYYPIAMESALKMKEVTYQHAEGMGAGFLKHGTLAMVEESLYSLFFIPLPEQKELYDRTIVAMEEVKARGGKVLGFAFMGDEKSKHLLDYIILLPKVHPLAAPLLQMISAQLFSYYSALHLGRNIDKPRNLAKSVTVA